MGGDDEVVQRRLQRGRLRGYDIRWVLAEEVLGIKGLADRRECALELHPRRWLKD